MSENSIFNTVDCVLMLTWSDWFTEPRSNRYHYATRFAKYVPVLFVQPTEGQTEVSCDRLADHNIYIVKVSPSYDSRTHRQIGSVLHRLGLKKPLVWTYNGFFFETVRKICAPIKIYHATEDYFCADFNGSAVVRDAVLQTIQSCDAIVAVSDGVKESYEGVTNFKVPTMVITNGVDFEFWHRRSRNRAGRRGIKVVYQGALNRKIDLDLLAAAISYLPDFDFVLCGKVGELHAEFEHLFQKKNVRHLGELRPDKLRQIVHDCDIGIMPFVQNDWLVKRSFPLKAFEYLAAGLPVVSTPIAALQRIGAPILWSETSLQFANNLKTAATLAADNSYLESLITSASSQDYEMKFNSLTTFLSCLRIDRRNADMVVTVIGPSDPHIPFTLSIDSEIYYFAYFPKMLLPDSLMLMTAKVFIANEVHQSLVASDPLRLWLKDFPGEVECFIPADGFSNFVNRRSESDFYFGDGFWSNTSSAKFPLQLYQYKNTKFVGYPCLSLLSHMQGPFPVLDLYGIVSDPIHVLSTASKVLSIKTLLLIALASALAAIRRMLSKFLVRARILKQSLLKWSKHE